MKTQFIDMHCHIIPGVDDGADDMEEALGMLKMEQEQGAQEIILTPHYRSGYFETSRERVQGQFEKLSHAAEREGIAVKLQRGCEFYRRNEMEQRLQADARYRMAGTKYVLVEFMPQDLADTIWRYCGELLIGGYRPVIAHAERYRALRDKKLVRRLIQAGAYIQLNAGSILGEAGWGTRHFCHMLLKENLVQFIGSDAHHLERRRPCLGACREYLNKKLGEEACERLLLKNPQEMLAGEYI